METHEIRDSIVFVNEGQKIFAVFHKPEGVVNPPVVLMCHGLAGHKTGRYRVYVDLAERLLEKKIAVLRFDFRGCGDSEGSFEDTTLKRELSDARVALDFLLQRSDIDHERIGFFGRSLGASVAVLMAAESQKAKSLVLWVPLFDGAQWSETWSQLINGGMSAVESEDIRRINGQVVSIPFYAEMFDMHIEEALKKTEKVPLLLIHGEVDELIGIQHSESYNQCRKGAEAETKFIRLVHCDHDFSYTSERLLALIETTNWFENTLK